MPSTPVAAPAAGALERHAALVIAALALVLSALVDPRGEFPVNDDWAYAHSVQWLLAEHRIRLSDWIAMNLLPQTLIGGAAAQIAGFSFSLMRHLTQAVSVAVAVLTLRWFLATGLARRDALVATLTVLAMPCWLPLANSFMTDLYAMLFALPAAMLFFRALREPKPALIAAATLLAAIGMLQRQVVAVVPAAFLIAWLAANRRWRPATLATGVLPLTIVFAAEFLYRAYLAHGPGIPEAQQYAHGRVLPALVKIAEDEGGWYRSWAVGNLLSILAYLGLFAAPWAIWRGLPLSRAARWGGVALAVAIAVAMALTGLWPPWREHHLIDAAGIGPFVLYDAQPRGLAPLDRSPGVLWPIAGVGAAFGIAALCRTALVVLRGIAGGVARDAGERLFLLALVVAYVAPFVVTDYIDRYLLFVLPFVLALMARGEPGSPTILARGVTTAWLGAALALGTMATHDYFAWNRARWDAIHAAEGLGATPATLDGGFEYNAYYRFELRPHERRPGKSWWWVEDDRYVVAFSVVPGYVERAQFPVRRWLPRTPPVVRLLERMPRP